MGSILKVASILLTVSMLLSGCAELVSQPAVWKHPEKSFSDYSAFEIRPVFNATGQPIDALVSDSLTTLLKESFAENYLEVIDGSESSLGILTVHSDLLVYFPQEHVESFKLLWALGWGKSICVLRSRLIDKATSQIVSEITVVKETNTGDLYLNQKSVDNISNWLLRGVSVATTQEIVKLISKDLSR
jgi:hypothetical protein